MSSWFNFFPVRPMNRILAFLAVFDPDTVQRWFELGGYFILFGLLFACGLGLPLPEDIPLLLGGWFVAQGKMNIVLVGILAWCGIIGGDCVLYWLSRRYGMNVTKLPLIRHHVTKERILWAEKKFDRWGVWVVAVCRLFAGVRGAMVVAAGAIKFNFVKFVIADGLAALVSGGAFVALGWWVGSRPAFKGKSIGEIRQTFKPYEHWIMAGIVAAALLAILYFWWRSRKKKLIGEVVVDEVDAVATQALDRRQAREGEV